MAALALRGLVFIGRRAIIPAGRAIVGRFRRDPPPLPRTAAQAEAEFLGARGRDVGRAADRLIEADLRQGQLDAIQRQADFGMVRNAVRDAPAGRITSLESVFEGLADGSIKARGVGPERFGDAVRRLGREDITEAARRGLFTRLTPEARSASQFALGPAGEILPAGIREAELTTPLRLEALRPSVPVTRIITSQQRQTVGPLGRRDIIAENDAIVEQVARQRAAEGIIRDNLQTAARLEGRKTLARDIGLGLVAPTTAAGIAATRAVFAPSKEAPKKKSIIVSSDFQGGIGPDPTPHEPIVTPTTGGLIIPGGVTRGTTDGKNLGNRVAVAGMGGAGGVGGAVVGGGQSAEDIERETRKAKKNKEKAEKIRRATRQLSRI